MKYDLTSERAAYNVLKSVYTDKAYSSIELDRALGQIPESYRGRTTALVYGVLEKSITLDFYISKLAEKKPKSNIEVLLKLAFYDLVYGQDKEYAVIDKFVELAKDRFNGAQGFVNAVLRKAKTVKLPGGGDTFALSVRYNCPEWVIRRFVRDYGERAYSLLSCELEKLTHIRYNGRVTDKAKFEKTLSPFKSDVRPSELGYYVNRSVLGSLSDDLFTAQSLASMKAVRAYIRGLSGHKKVLDLCAAPGGKSIYLAELLDAEITACDLHKHRVDLIKSYAYRMGCRINAVVNDAVKIREEWLDAFDLVICDVPCSGSGLFKSSPDILLFKNDEDVAKLSDLQYAILLAASKYVARGGVLAYSTCSLLSEENDGVADRFASNGFTELERTRLFPDTDGCDGFYIVRWKKD